MCQRTHWIAMVMVTAMLASGCAVFRRQPAQEPVPPPPPVIVESRPPQEPAEVPRHGLLTRSAMVVSVGLEAGGDALLEEFLRSGPAVGPEARSRALVLRALLVLHQGGERGGRMAKAYLQAAGQADPGGGERRWHRSGTRPAAGPGERARRTGAQPGPARCQPGPGETAV